MELILKRTYHEKGTNGKLLYGNWLVCYTIELPWFQNLRNVSCISEGQYEIIKRHTVDRGEHLRIAFVEDRDWILFHAANDARKELKGCIAPVSELTGDGKGSSSKKALDKFEMLVFEALAMNQKIILTIKNEKIMNIIERAKAPTPKLFKILRNIGLGLAATSAAILAAPLSLPAALVSVAGYLAIGGSVLSAVSQITIEN